MKSKLFKFTVFAMFMLLISVGFAFAQDNSTDGQALGDGECRELSQI